MVRKIILTFFFSIALVFTLTAVVFAEDKPQGGSIIPKLPKTANDPELYEGRVYPMWGPPCQRYTYMVTYRDKEGRAPEYVKIYFNGKMIDMTPAFDKSTAGKEDYQKGVRYEYKFVPNKIGSNFYYFEASNGKGKARASIIDSPDNGPVLFESAFDKNEIAAIDTVSGKKIINYPTGKEWIGGVALSSDGKYLAAKTTTKIYLFDTSKPAKPLWIFEITDKNMPEGEFVSDVKGGIDISDDGTRIFASMGPFVLLFNASSNKPLWSYEVGGSSYNVAISADGKYQAAATAGEESNPNSNLIILWNEKNKKPLWQYHSSGNFHDVSLSDDGSLIAGSTGCPDRRAYLFSKDSNKPLLVTDSLTRDSPVHRAKISNDGKFFAVGTEADKGAVILMSKDNKKPVWRFDVPGAKSVRGLNFTPDGNFIGAATFGGDIYIFNKNSSVPLASWNFNASFAGVDIADDGSFIAVGGTDKKLHILRKDNGKKIEVDFNEYIEEVDISGNGKYIAVGTGGSPYFFETIEGLEGKTYACDKIIEPPPMPDFESFIDGKGGGESASYPKVRSGFLGIFDRIVIFIKRIFVKETSMPKESIDNESVDFQDKKKEGKSAVCGNNLCEPDFGESKELCPRDCSASD